MDTYAIRELFEIMNMESNVKYDNTIERRCCMLVLDVNYLKNFDTINNCIKHLLEQGIQIELKIITIQQLKTGHYH